MKVSDYIVEFLIKHNITDVFGYPGGMITHLMDSLSKYSSQIKAHVNYHEQASSFCACGYAQVSNIPGVAYATSGPGATNLITGIANAFFDSIPCIFITGQVNTYESKEILNMRQKGFQETNIISIISDITKYAVHINNADMIRYELEKSYYICLNGRPGPVLLDIPMDIFRSEIDINNLKSYELFETEQILNIENISNNIINSLSLAKRPVILLGNGINISNTREITKKFLNKIKIPVITSMISVDILETNLEYNFGFIGTYGHRFANFILSQSDLILCLGTRLDCRQTGSNIRFFNNNIIRIDIDQSELSNVINENERQYNCDLKILMNVLYKQINNYNINKSEWLNNCQCIKYKLQNIDNQIPNNIINNISKLIPENYVITTDVGQNQVWVSQSFYIKKNQRVLFSGGHGAMGYSLPAAIGAYYATKKNVICFTGDGGLQMNIQELQFIKREQIPIKIIIINNYSLGMIRHFQEMYFNSNYTQTTHHNGYEAPNFERIAFAYNIKYHKIHKKSKIDEIHQLITDIFPCIIEISLPFNTYIFPKLAVNKPIYQQEPPLDNNIINELLNIIKSNSVNK